MYFDLYFILDKNGNVEEIKNDCFYALVHNGEFLLVNNIDDYTLYYESSLKEELKNLTKDEFLLCPKHLSEEIFSLSTIKNLYVQKNQFQSDDFKLKNVINEYKLPLYVYEKKSPEEDYLNIMKSIIKDGDLRQTRNSETYSDFAHHLKFDLKQGFPLLTTKKMNLRLIFEELMFFIRGQTNTKILEEKGINIWKGNTSQEFLNKVGLDYPEGEMGKMYGYQWRNFNSQGIDQLKEIINLLRTDPYSRRILMTTYNPAEINEGVLPPCHGISTQFFVRNGRLSCHMYQRSADWFLGVPFNIASYALLVHLLAKVSDLKVGELTMSFGDCHVYKEHKEVCLQQIERVPNNLPQLVVNKKKEIEEYEYRDITFIDYFCQGKLSAVMVA